MTTDNFCFYLQNRPFQTIQTGGQWYSHTPPFSIPCQVSHSDCRGKSRFNHFFSFSVQNHASQKGRGVEGKLVGEPQEDQQPPSKFFNE
jgi:hypothetical protein